MASVYDEDSDGYRPVWGAAGYSKADFTRAGAYWDGVIVKIKADRHTAKLNALLAQSKPRSMDRLAVKYGLTPKDKRLALYAYHLKKLLEKPIVPKATAHNHICRVTITVGQKITDGFKCVECGERWFLSKAGKNLEKRA